ncbi:DUF6493 family protein [uncultured Luteimonas sp.]|uniref:DUF6493 family protein n=1 Tax=uncultured Luteimonas sp. TaxID=453144 RepID=UPI0026033013|nr:DUF6493 family protein [uncultured Luteimonas sp.]
MATIFSPATPLEQAVHAGDVAQTLALLRALPREERARHRASARRMAKLLDEARWKIDDPARGGWGMPPSDAQNSAGVAVLVACGTAQDVASRFGWSKELVALCGEFRPDSLHGLADALLAQNPRLVETVQDLIVAGLVTRPDSDDYFTGLISLAYTGRFAELWAADAGLRDVLPGIMAVEGSSEFNLAAVDKYTGGHANWSATLRRLCGEGVYSKAFLLDRTLDALERDWPQFRTGWFSRFHAELEPDSALLAGRAPRYLALCHSRIPPTVTLALAVLKRLEPLQVIDDAALLDALRPVMHASAKGKVLAALKLIDGCVQRSPALGVEAVDVIVAALVHDSADVQGQVLQRLARWRGGAQLVERLSPYADGIAAVHRAAFRALSGAGDVPPEEAEVAAGADATRGPGPVSPVEDARRLEPPADPDALVALIAHVFENDADIDAFEMAAAALVQAAPLDALHLERLGPVIKRGPRVRGPVARELARLVTALTTGAFPAMQPARDEHGAASPSQQCLAARTEAWRRLAKRGPGLPPLSAATHRGGFIAARALIARALQYHRAGVDVELDEQVRALLRLAPTGEPDLVEAARALPDTPFARALRYGLGDDLAPDADHAALFAAAARIRCPGADDRTLLAMLGDIGPDGPLAARYRWRVDTWTSEAFGKTYRHAAIILETAPAPRPATWELLAVHRHHVAMPGETRWRALHHPGFGGREESLVRMSAALLPACQEAYFADGVRTIGNNLDWWQAQWADKAYLERLLDPAVAMGPMAVLLLALGLAAKEPGQQALAVDALVATWREGRIDPDALATQLRALSATPLVKASRYARSFRAALRIDPATHPLLFRLLCEMAVASPAEPQRDLALLLEILLELALVHGHALPDAIRMILRDMPARGRAGQLSRQLLAG